MSHRLEETIGRIYRSYTTMEDDNPLEWDSSPNEAVRGRTLGETTLISSPIGTVFIQSNGTIWEKRIDGWYDRNRKIAQGHPKTILPYWGRVEELEPGWVVCDGTRGTPDLRDRMIIGAQTDNDLLTVKINKVNLSIALPVLTQTAPDAVRLHWITYIGD